MRWSLFFSRFGSPDKARYHLQQEGREREVAAGVVWAGGAAAAGGGLALHLPASLLAMIRKLEATAVPFYLQLFEYYGLVNQMQSIAAFNTGCILHEGNCVPYSRVSGRAVISSYASNLDHKLFHHAKVLLRRKYSKRRSFVCTASNSPRKNPDFSRQSKGFSRGRNRQNQERESSENTEDATDLLSSKNGPLLSFSSNPRHQATATPGQREKEIVELFRKVQAQLRERAAIKDEKKVEATSQGQGERGTVDSLLKLLRKHSVDQGKKKSGEKNVDHNQPERSSPFEDGPNSSFLESSSIASEVDDENTSTPAVTRRPPSNFQRKSPVPRVKYQPVYSAQDSVNLDSPVKSAGKKKSAALDEDEEPVSLDEREAFDDEPLESSEVDDTDEDLKGPSSTEGADLSSLKISELRALAKSRGLKGYSKLKKSELVALLSGEED
ncbi:hypothetical protein Taro_007234 [Colocasia esculenta]|uniref:Rho termination factor-like N-terminal domain-containing protein n=1 Tax=Colocasia esculenta TaxID=4460 RepID=A0A843TTF3_COLES|nr:hypothetical protein [Colocasia esculenta]